MSADNVYPEFSGELWSYADARRRVPDAWKCTEYRHESWPEGVVQEHVEDVAPKGLGHWEVRDLPALGTYPGGRSWIYVQPNGVAIPVSDNYGKLEPPPLPRRDPEVQRCLHGGHTCSACGTKHWIEIHGMADGYCTYCYRRG